MTTARRRGGRLLAGLASTALVTSGGLFLADAPRSVATRAKTDPVAKASALEAYAKLPISFEVNHGQTDPQVKFMSRGADGTLFLTPNEAVLSLPTKAGKTATAKQDVLRMKLLGANPDAQVSGAKELPGKVNYLNAEPAKSYSNVPTYARAESKAVYPGIDMAWYGKGSNLEYDFIVAPGANPSTIKIGFEGATSLRLDKTGDLVMKVEGREVRQHKPVLYQEVGGERRPVSGRFVLGAGKQVGFSVGTYDRSRPLVIDPVLAWSSFLGGSGTDDGFELEFDADNIWVAGNTSSPNFPVRGSPLQPSQGNPNQLFVAKLIEASTDDPSEPLKPVLSYSTYVGGTGSAIMGSTRGLALDGAGSPTVAAAVGSTYPTTPGAFQPVSQNPTGNQYAVTKLTPDGSALAYSTFVTAPSGSLSVNALDVDAAGDIYLGGGANFNSHADAPAGTPGAYQTSCVVTVSFDGSQFCSDAYVARLHPTADVNDNDMSYFTYIGGARGDQLSDLEVDSSGIAYLTGNTTSTYNPDRPDAVLFPTTPGAFNRRGAGSLTGDPDAWVAKFNLTNSELVYSTLLGGSGNEFPPASVAAGPDGTIFVAGVMNSPGFNDEGGEFPITAGALQTVYGGSFGEVYLSRINPDPDDLTPGDLTDGDTDDLIYSSFLGGTRNDNVFGMVVDENGFAYLTGGTGSDNFPSKNSLQKRCSCFYDAFTGDVFVVKVNPDPNNPNSGAGDPGDLLFGTFLGGTGGDAGRDLALDSSGSIYVSGVTGNKGTPPDGIRPRPFPIKEAFQKRYGGGSFDAFVAKISGV